MKVLMNNCLELSIPLDSKLVTIWLVYIFWNSLNMNKVCIFDFWYWNVFVLSNSGTLVLSCILCKSYSYLILSSLARDRDDRYAFTKAAHTLWAVSVATAREQKVAWIWSIFQLLVTTIANNVRRGQYYRKLVNYIQTFQHWTMLVFACQYLEPKVHLPAWLDILHTSHNAPRLRLTSLNILLSYRRMLKNKVLLHRGICANTEKYWCYFTLSFPAALLFFEPFQMSKFRNVPRKTLCDMLLQLFLFMLFIAMAGL